MFFSDASDQDTFAPPFLDSTIEIVSSHTWSNVSTHTIEESSISLFLMKNESA